MNIIYHNRKTKSYAEISLGAKENIDFFARTKSLDEIASDAIEYIIDSVVSLGCMDIFPEDLFRSFKDENEVDLFLMASVSNEYKKSLKEMIFIEIPENFPVTYKELATNETVFTEAIGLNQVIVYKENKTDIDAACVSYEFIENTCVDTAHCMQNLRLRD